MSKKWRSTQITGSAIVCAVLGQAHADIQYQDTESIKHAVNQAVLDYVQGYTYSNLQVSVRSIDGRLRLKKCTQDLDASVSNPTKQLGRLTTEVSCQGESPWKIYVQSTTTAEMLVPVLTKPMSRGEIVREQNIQLKSVPVGQQSLAIVESIESLIGMELKRQIAAGQPILISQVSAPEVVKRGQRVNIRYDDSELKITVAGKALENGAFGDWISVENAGSGRRIEGRINSDGSVSIPGMSFSDLN